MANQSPELPSPQCHNRAVGFRGEAPGLGDPHGIPGLHHQVALRKVRGPIAAVPGGKNMVVKFGGEIRQ